MHGQIASACTDHSTEKFIDWMSLSAQVDAGAVLMTGSSNNGLKINAFLKVAATAIDRAAVLAVLTAINQAGGAPETHHDMRGQLRALAGMNCTRKIAE